MRVYDAKFSEPRWPTEDLLAFAPSRGPRPAPISSFKGVLTLRPTCLAPDAGGVMRRGLLVDVPLVDVRDQLSLRQPRVDPRRAAVDRVARPDEHHARVAHRGADPAQGHAELPRQRSLDAVVDRREADLARVHAVKIG